MALGILVKDDDKAAMFRSMGNRAHDKKQFFDALLNFNKSLCFAQSHPSLALCYANRAAVFLELKLYDRCLYNLQLSRMCNNYPMDLVLNREIGYLEKCVILLKNRRDNDLGVDGKLVIEEFLKLSYPANSKVPFAAGCLEVKENKDFGRYVVTNRDLKAGDIIAITPNIYNAINPAARFHHCSFCLKSNDMDLIPCPGCPKSKKRIRKFRDYLSF